MDINDRLGHLTAAGVAGAEEEDFALHSSINAFVRKVVISASLGTRPAQTTFSLMTRPGVARTLYFMISAWSVTFSTFASILRALTAREVRDARFWQFWHPGPRTLIVSILTSV
jgi:hypothetical protein